VIWISGSATKRVENSFAKDLIFNISIIK